MTDDELVRQLKKQWGVRETQPAELLLAVSLRNLLHFTAASFDAVGVATGYGLVIGDAGRPLATEMDRYRRELRYRLSEMIQTP